MSNPTVVVVGAGLAGLSAAKLLHDSGVNVVVLEARDRVGGRTLTRDGVDLGGSFIGRDKRRSLYVAQSLGVKFAPVYCAGLNTFSLNGKVSHTSSVIPDLKVIDFRSLMGLLTAMLDLYVKGFHVPLDDPWNSSQADKWDAMTVEDWIKARTALPDARTFIQFIVQVLLGVEPSEISFLYFLWYIRSGHGIIETLSGAQDAVFDGGSQQISEKLADILDAAVHLEHQVVKISQTDEGLTVSTANGKTFGAQYCILAVTPTARDSIEYSPPLDSLYDQLPKQMKMGSIIKTFTFYNRLWWRIKGYSRNGYDNRRANRANV